MSNHIPRVADIAAANNTNASTGTGRIYVDSMHKFFIGLQSDYLTADDKTVLEAFEINWYWVHAPRFDIVQAYRPLPIENNNIDVLWPVDDQLVAGVKMTQDLTLKLDGLAQQGTYHYLVIESDSATPYTLTFESGFFMDRNGDSLTSYVVQPNKGVVIPFVAIFNNLLQVPLHL